jgi:hypothetical protein
MAIGRRANLGGAGVRGNKSRVKVMGAVALVTLLGAHSIAAEPTVNSSGAILEPAVWQGPEINAPSTTSSTADSTHSAVNPLRVAFQPAAPVPPQNAYVPLTGAKAPTKPPAGALSPAERASAAAGAPASPLLDGSTPAEQMLPPVMEGGCASGSSSDGPLHVQAYGGGHPTDWSWGCGGSPYREGPGMCDNYKVGPRWHITVDGIVMSREQTTLSSLEAQMRANNTFMGAGGNPATGGIDYAGGTSDSAGALLTPQDENFHYGPGGRVTFMSQVGRCTGWDLQAVYEGINNWNASVVFPKEALLPTSLVIAPNPNTEPNASTPGTPPLFPPDAAFPEGFVQRSLHYRSDLNSGEFNFFKNDNSEWRLFCGVRFIRFDDEINDFLNQDRQAPLAGPLTAAAPGLTTLVNDPIGPTSETDRMNLYHIQNNLTGFQIGMLHDTLCLTDRFAIEGFLNAGVYYNQVKYSNVMGVFTTQTFADNTRTSSGARVDVSNIVNNDSRDMAEISYMTEASVTGVCRLNKCWAMRAGYQFMWMDHIHTAEQAFLGNASADSDLMFQGWHAGLECRR